MSVVARPALIVHAFAPVGAASEDVQVTDAYLRGMWSAARSLGMNESLLDGLPLDLPAVLPTSDVATFALLAGMTTSRTDRVAQAFAFIRHDVVGVGIALASVVERGRLETWAAIVKAWRRAGGDQPMPPQLLGLTHTFLAHAAVDENEIAKLFAEDVRRVLRSVGLDRWDATYRTAEGVTLWDWQDSERGRVVVALSELADEDVLSQWVWWHDDQELATFGRYLLNASKLAYESRVYGMTRAGVKERVQASDTRIAALRSPEQVPAHSGGLQTAQLRLADAQAESSELAIELSRLRALQRTIGIARHNLALTTPPPSPAQRTTGSQMFERDQALGTWLDGQIDQDAGYAQGAVERAREAQQVGQLRLQQQLAQLTRAQSRVALLQTSLVAALLASFAMINVFGIHVQLSDPLRWPALAAGVAFLVALPPLAAHWFERYGLIDHLAATFCAAAVGWLVFVLVAGDPPALPSLVAALLGAFVGRLLTAAHDRRFSADVSPSGPGE